jgi:hypothetical protein
MTQVKDRRGGLYFKYNKAYLSVTEIINKVLDKPSLRYWFGQQVYLATIKDPSIDEKEALSAPYKVSNKAKDRGSTIHSIVEAYKETGEIIDKIPDDYKGYAQAFYDFMNTFDIKILEQEKTIFSNKHMIAGTLDIFAKIKDKQYIIDVKTGKDIYQEAGLQLSAYAEIMRENSYVVDDIAILLLETGKDGLPTGKYKFQTMTDDFETFNALKRVYIYLNKDRLITLGYQW